MASNKLRIGCVLLVGGSAISACGHVGTIDSVDHGSGGQSSDGSAGSGGLSLDGESGSGGDVIIGVPPQGYGGYGGGAGEGGLGGGGG